MRAYLKELIIAVASILFLSIAVVAYFKAVSREKENSRPDAIYTPVPGNVRTLMAVNRPLVFSEMMNHDSFRRVFETEMPEIYFTLVDAIPKAPLVVFSFHPQGVVCYMQASAKTTGSIINDLLPDKFKPYTAHRQTWNGLDFYYYPDTDGRFFGYYVHNGVWAGSYSSKLLEQSAAQQQTGELSLPAGMNRLRMSLNANEPVNIVFRANELGLSDAGYLSADLYMSGGNIYCRGSIATEALNGIPHASAGDVLSRRITSRYPYLRLEVRTETEGEYIDYTAYMSR
ncbi:MAG: hypothetical protein LBJ58_01910 [Tannerellaceae bacterium]|jgi:hypothetical protein|nr:hypothetical protein [Tannerellaceae bacterium]